MPSAKKEDGGTVKTLLSQFLSKLGKKKKAKPVQGATPAPGAVSAPGKDAPTQRVQAAPEGQRAVVQTAPSDAALPSAAAVVASPKETVPAVKSMPTSPSQPSSAQPPRLSVPSDNTGQLDLASGAFPHDKLLAALESVHTTHEHQHLSARLSHTPDLASVLFAQRTNTQSNTGMALPARMADGHFASAVASGEPQGQAAIRSAATGEAPYVPFTATATASAAAVGINSAAYNTTHDSGTMHSGTQNLQEMLYADYDTLERLGLRTNGQGGVTNSAGRLMGGQAAGVGSGASQPQQPGPRTTPQLADIPLPAAGGAAARDPRTAPLSASGNVQTSALSAPLAQFSAAAPPPQPPSRGAGAAAAAAATAAAEPRQPVALPPGTFAAPPPLGISGPQAQSTPDVQAALTGAAARATPEHSTSALASSVPSTGQAQAGSGAQGLPGSVAMPDTGRLLPLSLAKPTVTPVDAGSVRPASPASATAAAAAAAGTPAAAAAAVAAPGGASASTAPPAKPAAAAPPAAPSASWIHGVHGDQPVPLSRPMKLTTACLGAHTTLCDSAADQSFHRALQRKMQMVYKWLQASDLTVPPDPRLEILPPPAAAGHGEGGPEAAEGGGAERWREHADAATAGPAGPAGGGETSTPPARPVAPASRPAPVDPTAAAAGAGPSAPAGPSPRREAPSAESAGQGQGPAHGQAAAAPSGPTPLTAASIAALEAATAKAGPNHLTHQLSGARQGQGQGMAAAPGVSRALRPDGADGAGGAGPSGAAAAGVLTAPGGGGAGEVRAAGEPGPTGAVGETISLSHGGEYGTGTAAAAAAAAGGGGGSRGAAHMAQGAYKALQGGADLGGATPDAPLQHSLSDLYASGQASLGTTLPPRVLATNDEAFAGAAAAAAAAAAAGGGAADPHAVRSLVLQGVPRPDGGQPSAPRHGSGGPPARTKTIAVASHCPPELQPQPATASWTIEDFALLKKLYEGSLSVVCQAQHKRSGRHVALKIYKRSRLHEMERFQLAREICLHIRIVHPYVVGLFAAWKDSKYVYLALEWAPQGNMFDFLVARGGRLSEEEAARVVLRPLLAALAFLHQQHFIHRDVKLENLLLDASCNLKLADFGLAIDQKFEQANTRLGTFGYFAPEVLDCPLKKGPFDLKDTSVPGYDCRVDVWGAGVVGYEVLTGRAPFSASSPAKIIQAIRTRVLEFPGISEEGKDFLRSALTRDPAARPSARQLLSHPWIVRHCGAAAAHPPAGTVAVAATSVPMAGPGLGGEADLNGAHVGLGAALGPTTGPSGEAAAGGVGTGAGAAVPEGGEAEAGRSGAGAQV
ncbi:hypothetical protein HYH03_008987 [Edaphochlamys debaryana]|uniref:Protein kinase domain-containing protein n=1 Tax=Edaphochlamys debaryana TaxID=47281 RepID=A0A835Y069_9CHLO|nr:hypothetical protein HYH03_008987 [Edaphochlamys debaryana]|eukprot:KAG2492832.1 hypothetical protein HYH03_008987 [Edaphochlamys debaryana]